MKLYDVADLALRNLRESIFSQFTHHSGISVGVASLVAMLSLGIDFSNWPPDVLRNLGCSTQSSPHPP